MLSQYCSLNLQSELAGSQTGKGSNSGLRKHAVRRNDGHLVPVAIELWHLDGSGPEGKTTVHTPANTHPQASRRTLPRKQSSVLICDLMLAWETLAVSAATTYIIMQAPLLPNWGTGKTVAARA